MTRIQMRRDTSTNWSVNNPTPANGEPCYETDTRKFKIGDGVTKYTNLPYQGGVGSGGRATNEHMGHLAMPSDKYIDLTLGASGTTYTAPADGWFSMRGVSTAEAQFMSIFIYKDSTFLYSATSQPAKIGYNAEILIPVSKGKVAEISYNLNATALRFIYAVGSEPIT